MYLACRCCFIHNTFTADFPVTPTPTPLMLYISITRFFVCVQIYCESGSCTMSEVAVSDGFYKVLTRKLSKRYKSGRQKIKVGDTRRWNTVCDHNLVWLYILCNREVGTLCYDKTSKNEIPKFCYIFPIEFSAQYILQTAGNVQQHSNVDIYPLPEDRVLCLCLPTQSCYNHM